MEQYQRYCLANFKDQFVFCIAQAQTRRYCIALHIWENVPITPGPDRDSRYQGVPARLDKKFTHSGDIRIILKATRTTSMCCTTLAPPPSAYNS